MLICAKLNSVQSNVIRDDGKLSSFIILLYEIFNLSNEFGK